jgi:hypothetical protein
MVVYDTSMGKNVILTSYTISNSSATNRAINKLVASFFQRKLLRKRNQLIQWWHAEDLSNARKRVTQQTFTLTKKKKKKTKKKQKKKKKKKKKKTKKNKKIKK